MPRLTLPSFERLFALAACKAKEDAPLLAARLARRVVFLGCSLLPLLLHWTKMMYYDFYAMNLHIDNFCDIL